METKAGTTIPPELAAELTTDKRFKSAWDMLRPSCQKDYVERIAKARPEAKSAKLERVRSLTIDYAARHPGKYLKTRKIVS